MTLSDVQIGLGFSHEAARGASKRFLSSSSPRRSILNRVLSDAWCPVAVSALSCSVVRAQTTSSLATSAGQLSRDTQGYQGIAGRHGASKVRGGLKRV